MFEYYIVATICIQSLFQWNKTHYNIIHSSPSTSNVSDYSKQISAENQYKRFMTLDFVMAVFINHLFDGKVAGIVKFTTVLLEGATSVGSVQVFLDQGLEFFGKAQDFSVLEVAEEVDHLSSGGTELGSVLVDLADQALLAVEVGGVEFSVGLLADADPVDDVELLPVNGVWVER